MVASRHDRPNAGDERFLFDSIKAGDLARVKQMLHDDGNLLFIEDDHEWSPVLRATHSPHPEVADHLSRILLQRIRVGTIPRDNFYGAIHDLGEALHSGTGFRGCETLRMEAEPVIAGYLMNDDSSLRWLAVSVLSAHWDLRRYADVFQQMSLSDSDDSVRKIALSSVGWLLRSTKDHNAARFLLSIFRDPGQDASMRQTAYKGLVEVWQGANAAHTVFMSMMRIEESLGAAGRAGEEDRGIGSRSRTEKAWEDVVDWGVVSEVEGELKNRT